MPCCIKHTARPSGTMVSRLDKHSCIKSLSKTTHQMWCDHPFSQRNKATKKAGGKVIGGEGVCKIW